MNAMMMSLRTENGQLRGLTGQGEPGLFSLLGGTAREKDSSQLTTMGGPGQTSATAKLAEAYRDKRLAAVASGNPVPGGGGGDGGGDGTDPAFPQNPR